jgi:hypothetical protein
MDKAAALQNDPLKTQYTYTKQLPFLNMALGELEEIFEQNEIPVTTERSVIITVPAGTTVIGFAPVPPIALTPYLPDNLIEILRLWERTGSGIPYTPVTKTDTLDMENTPTNQFNIYVWESQEIRLLAASVAIELKLEYIKSLFVPFTDVAGAEEVAIINAKSFLQFRTGGLLAEFLGENTTRANALNSNASLAIDRATGIPTKGKQDMMTRRRPFRAGFKRRS